MRVRSAAFVLCLLAARPALAQGPDPKAAALALAKHGYSLYEAGKYAEAIDALEHAERLYHAPTLVFAAARAYAASGKLVEARALFVRVRDEKLAPDAPQAFKTVKNEAPAEIDELQKRIPTVAVLVRGGGGKGLRVSVDDNEVRDYQPDKPIAMNAGAHRIAVVPLGGVGVTRGIDVREGARIVVEIELAGAAPLVVKGAPSPAPDAGPAPWRLPGYLMLGIGGAVLALGAGATVYAGLKSSELDKACPTGKCSSHEYDSDISLGRSMNVTGNVSFVVGGAGVVAGVVWLLVKPKSSKSQEPSKTSIQVGPGTIGVEGVF